ncbi:MAG TPA: LD-carboxypeptidase [Kofleriaceae bacterium]|nr:LD-carboxypeptidase [Kofleriaceae bacterium]
MSECTTLPPRVRPGDTVGICAPASPVPGDRLRRGIERLDGRYRLRMADDITRVDGYLAGSDDRRADELNGLIADPDVRAILLARGGYGILRILDRLDAGALRADPKPIVGFSDATALLFWALAAAGLRGIHGPVVAQLGDLPVGDTTWLVDLLEGRGQGRIIEGLRPTGAVRRGRVEGPLIGGNLTLLSHMVGTPWAADVAGAVLFIEDQGERPYAIDRYLTRMALGGALRGAGAALVGSFTRCEERVNLPQPDAAAVVDERLRAFDVAGLAGAPFGHGDENQALPFGGRAALDFDRGAVELLDPAVG